MVSKTLSIWQLEMRDARAGDHAAKHPTASEANAFGCTYLVVAESTIEAIRCVENQPGYDSQWCEVTKVSRFAHNVIVAPEVALANPEPAKQEDLPLVNGNGGSHLDFLDTNPLDYWRNR